MRYDLYENMFTFLEDHVKKAEGWSEKRKARAAETVRVYDAMLTDSPKPRRFGDSSP